MSDNTQLPFPDIIKIMKALPLTRFTQCTYRGFTKHLGTTHKVQCYKKGGESLECML